MECPTGMTYGNSSIVCSETRRLGRRRDAESHAGCSRKCPRAGHRNTGRQNTPRPTWRDCHDLPVAKGGFPAAHPLRFHFARDWRHWMNARWSPLPDSALMHALDSNTRVQFEIVGFDASREFHPNKTTVESSIRWGLICRLAELLGLFGLAPGSITVDHALPGHQHIRMIRTQFRK